MGKSKYHKESVVTVRKNGEDIEILRRKAVRMPIIKETESGGKVRIFASEIKKLREDGSLVSNKEKLTKAERKQMKRNRQRGII